MGLLWFDIQRSHQKGVFHIFRYGMYWNTIQNVHINSFISYWTLANIIWCKYCTITVLNAPIVKEDFLIFILEEMVMGNMVRQMWRTEGRTDEPTERSVLRAAWAQLLKASVPFGIRHSFKVQLTIWSDKWGPFCCGFNLWFWQSIMPFNSMPMKQW